MKHSSWSRKSKQENKPNLTRIDEYWSSLKKNDYDSSFREIKSWIRDVTSQKSILKPKRKLEIMKYFIIANKFKFATVILAAVLIYACNLPVTQEKTVGHVLSWTVDGNDNEAVHKIEKLKWRAIAGLLVMISGLAIFYLV